MVASGRELAVAVAASEMRAGKPRRLGPAWADVLADLPLFEGLSRRHLRRIAAAAEAARFLPERTIIDVGRPGDSFFVLIDGTARLEGGGGVDSRLGPGDFFGELSLLDGGPRTARVTAEGEVLALRLRRRAFEQVLAEEPRIAVCLLRELARRIRAMQASARD
jgi:CRP-like cAMP-binding protein